MKTQWFYKTKLLFISLAYKGYPLACVIKLYVLTMLILRGIHYNYENNSLINNVYNIIGKTRSMCYKLSLKHKLFYIFCA